MLQRHRVRAARVPEVSQASGRTARDRRRDRGDRGEVRPGSGHHRRRVLPAHAGGRVAQRRPVGVRVPQRGRAEGAQRRAVAEAARRVRDSRGTGRRRPAHRQHRPPVPGGLAVHAARVPVVLHPAGTVRGHRDRGGGGRRMMTAPSRVGKKTDSVGEISVYK